jgi:hypothetical protein
MLRLHRKAFFSIWDTNLEFTGSNEDIIQSDSKVCRMATKKGTRQDVTVVALNDIKAKFVNFFQLGN